MDFGYIKSCVYDKRVQKCFWAAVFFGFFSYLYCFVNNLNNYDNIACTPGGAGGYGTGILSGRWMLSILGDFIDKWWGNYNIPIFNGVVAILFLALAACVLTQIFEVENEFFYILFGGITAVFPAVASGMFFTYTIHYYMLGVLFAVIGVWCAKNGKLIGLVCCGLLLACSLGIYQAYYPLAVGVFILLLIKITLNSDCSLKQIIILGFKYLAALILGYVFYRVILSLCLNLYGTALGDYQGINEMGKISMSQLPVLVLQTYKQFLKLPFMDYMSITATRVLKISVLGIYIITLASVIILALQKQFKKTALLILLLAFFPAAVNLIIIMVPNGEIYTLMVMGLLSVFYLPLVLADNINIKDLKMQKSVKTLAAIILSVCVLNYVWLNNGNYRGLYYSNKQLENYYATMYTRIKSAENYRQDLPVKLIGKEIDDTSYFNNWEETPFTYGGNKAQLNAYSRLASIRNYLGYYSSEVAVGSEEYEKYRSEVEKMSRYPDYGSVKVVEDAVLVRIE